MLAPKTQQISILHSNLDALLYPIFFPYGDQGWHDGLKQQGKSSRRITQLQYYCYMLSVRNYFNPLLNGGKLTQQYLVDAYVKIEANRLHYIRKHQKDLKVEDYCLLQEHLLKKSVQKGIPIGKTVILPSSFEGSPRNMQQRYQDAMAIVTKYGRPDLFITMTCNPKWNEITTHLEPWQRVEHRPDLVARVFKIKLESLLKDISSGLFGNVTAMVHVIEFQKRGLPHAHILIILDSLSKLQTEADIDNIVWAEIPDETIYPQLHNIVLQHMIHGPCGEHNPNSPCMDLGKCSKGFPKQNQPYTIKEKDGYPTYRRPIGKIYEHHSKTIDNSWVVPYNPFLLTKYKCHINIEICASIQSVKYLFKYVYKGHDKANLEISQNNIQHDETHQFTDTRYVSAPEAAWRIFAFPMHKQSHAIIRLAVHLPNSQPLYFHENDSADNIHQKLNSNSTLMAYFNLNKIDHNAHNYFYREIPEHYVWKQGTWEQRKRGGLTVIGRMYTVSVKDQERYYLRLLLLHVKAATSFDSIKTVNGVMHETFKDVDADEAEECENYPVEFLNSLTPSGMPSHLLKLKIGTIVMLLRNLNTKKGFCNGTRLIVIALLRNIIQAKVITGSAEGDIVFIPRIDLCPSETGLPFKLKRRQFPLKPAFAMTINKSQGQTLNRVGIFLPEPVFAHGQLYVAFSRVKQRSNVRVKVVDTPLQGQLLPNSPKIFTRNIFE
ncbi:uncharacterized protein [Dendrobates tinctorius]|uniref:uncharacterized protein n=1 Tax=Dendrobates tinctorius TaxID=92724 RepID=UPI003CC965F0